MQKDVNWRFIVNPAAGRGAVSRRWPQLETALRASGIAFDTVYTERKNHAAFLATEAIRQGFRHIAAVGGDGTAHETVNGIFNQDVCIPQKVTFALLPVGTGNDWIKTHRISKKFHRWLPCFLKGNTLLQDVGLLTFQKDHQTEKRYFINVAGLSYDGYVTKKSEQITSSLPSRLHYLMLTTRCLFKFTTPPARILYNGTTKEGKFLTINAGICRYSGGGMQLVPHAIPDDGRLALTIAGNISKAEVLLATPLFYSGKLNWHPAVSFHQTESVTVQPAGSDPVWLEADGEFLGQAPVKISILKQVLKVIVP